MTIVCPTCDWISSSDVSIQESSFEWTCPSCGRSFEIRIVFFSSRAPVNRERFRQEVMTRMEEQGLNKSQLARLLDVSPAYISTILSGRRNVSADLAARVMHVLQRAE